MTTPANESGAAPVKDDADTTPTDSSVLAQAYLDRGWNIFPIPHGSKKPWVNWTKDLSWVGPPRDSDAMIAAFFKGKRSNVGIATGERSSFWVLDLDPGKDGITNFAALVAEHGSLPETFTVQTRSGGWHYYFTMPDFDLRNTTDLHGAVPGVDVRANGGYVVAAPSFVEEDEKGRAGHYIVVVNTPPVAAPDWLLELARKPAPNMATTVVSTGTPTVLDDDTMGRAKGYVDKVVSGEAAVLRSMKDAATPNGSGYTGPAWDATVHAVCCNLAELVLADWAPFTKEEAAALLKENAPTDSGFTIGDVAGKFTRALSEMQPRPMPVFAQPVSFEDLTAGIPTRGPQAPQPSEVPTFKVVTPETEAYHFTHSEALQADIAHRFAAFELGVSTLFIGGLGWHRWDGKCFAPIPDDAVFKTLGSWISREVGPMQEEFKAKAKAEKGYVESPEGKRLANLIKGYTAVLDHAGNAKGVISWARARVRHEAHKFDAQPHLLNVQNGIVDLRTGALMPHDPFLMMTKVAAISYVEGATHPDWDQALRALPSDEVRDYMQVVFGQAITGTKPDDDRARILEGSGANGKSTIVTPILTALGSYATVASDKILLAAGNEHTTDLTDLKGVRMALLEELPETGGTKPSINIARLKKMLGTERMKARRMRQDNIEWEVTHSLLITTNYMVAVNDTDHGTWRRLCRVVFPFRFTEEPVADLDIKADPLLRDRVKYGNEGQHQAALSWAVKGAVKWYANGSNGIGRMPGMPERVKDDTDVWREQQDLIFAFLNADIVEFKRGSFVTTMELYSAFSEFCPDAMPVNAFVSKFAGHGVVKDRSVTAARRKTTNLNLSRLDPAVPLPVQTISWSGLAFTSEHLAARTFGFNGEVGA